LLDGQLAKVLDRLRDGKNLRLWTKGGRQSTLHLLALRQKLSRRIAGRLLRLSQAQTCSAREGAQRVRAIRRRAAWRTISGRHCNW